MINWNNLQGPSPKAYKCPYCNNQVAAHQGYRSNSGNEIIYICPLCTEPTYFGSDKQIPNVAFGDRVEDLPGQVEALYEEARRCMSVSAYTASVMLCRKVLMNVAVQEGANENQSFASYVDYLASEGYVPPKGKGWVDHIRTTGNEANHEIEQMNQKDAEELVLFTGMLLKFMYELPAKRPEKSDGDA